MSLILSIETATSICSVALHHAGELIAHSSLLKSCSHAEYLMVMVENLLKIAKFNKKELVAIALSNGPGSYTGLRIGAAVAKGLCYGLDIPLIAVGTLAAMAHGVSPFVGVDTLLCPTIDARRAAIYTLIVRTTGYIERPAHVALLDDQAYIASLPDQALLFFGEGALKCKKFLTASKHIAFLSEGKASAIEVGKLAFPKFQEKLWEDLEGYTPCYLSQF
ncbi:MAG: tRNA (adenosine(37)-N6)-threonylcarbamoyltransferase complex dimerization subunit type 1 TsaB [Amoebophilaceae bacterium]|nr:tRNA (adenosine(37)-N6)-threonylcarbamoyltransferase complex dimerization subunit type 1 TsaB [Amoebophilaceae bacterium]